MPRCPLKKAQRIERLLAELDFVQDEKRRLGPNLLSFVLSDAPDKTFDVIGRPVEDGANPREVSLEVEPHEPVGEQLLSHMLGERGLAHSPRPLNEQRPVVITGCPLGDRQFQLALHIVHKRPPLLN